MLDLIGDIHGHADQLEALLRKLGYHKKGGVYRHSERKVLFVGDYIDRGPQIRESLRLVRAMTEADSAIALMGNHEYNALCFHYQDRHGGHLRKHKIKNILQHYESLRQFQHAQEEYDSHIAWFMNLPLFYETEQFRAVHACWDAQHIDYLRSHLVEDRLNEELLYQSADPEGTLHQAIEVSLKGQEIALPDKLSFADKDGNERREIRIKWWEDPHKVSYREISILPLSGLPDKALAPALAERLNPYAPSEKMVFFGHYWLRGRPSLYRDNICCLDYSVAKGGHLVAYRLDSETRLSEDKLVYV